MEERAKQQVADRPYTVDLGLLTPKDWEVLSVQPCAFCGSVQKSDTRGLSNISVMNWQRPVDTSNVMPCCQLCWSTRSGLSPRSFVRHCRRIQQYSGSAQRRRDYLEVMKGARRAPVAPKQRVTQLARDIRKRNRQKCSEQDAEDSLGLAFVCLQFPCWYCGRRSSGIDRLNSLTCPSYDPENSVPCCGQCNSMKHVLPRGVFLRHARYVADRNADGQVKSRRA